MSKINYNWNEASLFTLCARSLESGKSLSDIYNSCRSNPATYGDSVVLSRSNPDKMRSALSQVVKTAPAKKWTQTAKHHGATDEQIRAAVRYCRPKAPFADNDAITLLECINALRRAKGKEMAKLAGSGRSSESVAVDIDCV